MLHYLYPNYFNHTKSQDRFPICVHLNRFIVSYPNAKSHTRHDVTSELGQLTGELSQRLSKPVIDSIFNFVEKGLRDARAIRTFLVVEYSKVCTLKSMIFVPHISCVQ